jgi:hypothetical protein
LIHQLDIGDLSSPEEHMGYVVKSISPKETHWFLMNRHYAKRIPPVSFAFGLFLNSQLVGVVTYGKPASMTLCNGICGEEYTSEVIELNRLSLLDNKKGEASRLIANSLKLLPKPKIVVSFADTSQSHTGIVYQATNWIYTGLSAARKEYAIKGMEHVHSRTISGMGSIVEIKEKYGDDFYYRERSRKHRYIYFLGSKTEIKERKAKLRYKVLPYPKIKPI